MMSWQKRQYEKTREQGDGRVGVQFLCGKFSGKYVFSDFKFERSTIFVQVFLRKKPLLLPPAIHSYIQTKDRNDSTTRTVSLVVYCRFDILLLHNLYNTNTILLQKQISKKIYKASIQT